MKFPNILNFAGGRIVKTGIAVFVTALICHLFNWSAMFAVIAAIVTIEPTTSDSIKKALVRFPATAIGTAYAVLFTFLFKDSAFSYAFVALATFITCHKLKLHAGTLVATITGAAMITTVQDHYFLSFVERLASTSTGLVVSSLVNLLVMPPNYSLPITNGIHSLYQKTSSILSDRGREILHIQPCDKGLQKEFRKLLKDLDKIENLCHYQKEEWKYHRVKREGIREYRFEYKKLMILRQIVHHVGNLIYLPSLPLQLEQRKKEHILATIKSIEGAFVGTDFWGKEDVHNYRRDLTEWFYEIKESMNLEGFQKDSHCISPERALLYEILSLYDLSVRLKQIQSLHHRKHSATTII